MQRNRARFGARALGQFLKTLVTNLRPCLASKRAGLSQGLLAGLALCQQLTIPVSANAASPGMRGWHQESFQVTLDYVARFYPLWFSHYQSQISPRNQLYGPNRISPLYHVVVAINNDTLYASTVLDLTAQPVILTIPPTAVSYSLLTLNAYGEIFDSHIPPHTAGTYALVGPHWSGTLPDDVVRIDMPFDISFMAFRADKYSTAGEDQLAEAESFRRSLVMQPLCARVGEACTPGTPPGGPTAIIPEVEFSFSFKLAADLLIAKEPIRFLKSLQMAVASPNTPPLSADDAAVSARFDQLFGSGEFAPGSGDTELKAQFTAGAQAAHDLIVQAYLQKAAPNGWISFTNIGAWGDRYFERAAITEFLQYGNGRATAAYYHAFVDAQGAPLDGRRGKGLVLTFPADQIPAAKRFWSLTAYTPETVELVRNPADKYEVASYTPDLEFNEDHSLSIYMAAELPPGVPPANWLPVPRGPFNVMLRVYGPDGSVADDTYHPPGITILH